MNKNYTNIKTTIYLNYMKFLEYNIQKLLFNILFYIRNSYSTLIGIININRNENF